MHGMQHCHLSHSDKPHIFAILLLPFKLKFYLSSGQICKLEPGVFWYQRSQYTVLHWQSVLQVLEEH